jgi:hypothetical protein
MPVVTPAENVWTIAESLLRQTAAQGTQEYSAAQKLMWTGQGIREMQRQLSLCNKEYYYDTATFDMTDGVSQYDLGTIISPFNFRKLVRLRRMDMARPWTVRKIQGGWPQFESYEEAYPSPSIDARVQRCKLVGRTLWIAPTPSQTKVDAFEALYEKMLVPQGGLTDLSTDELEPTPDEWVDFAGWWTAYLATQQDEETGEKLKQTALTMLASLRSDMNHEFKGEPRLAVPLEEDGY